MMIIDRFEGDYAIIEIDEEFIRIPKKFLPKAKEGDALKIIVDEEENRKRNKRIDELMNDLFQ